MSPSELSGFTVAGLNYRGYGSSEGKASETALKADALTVYDALAARLGPGVPIVVMGRSLGSGIAAYVAAHRDVAGVILVTPYDSLVDVGQDAHPLVPVSLLMRNRFDVAPDAARVKAPTLMLVAGADTLIPPRHAARLAALWAGPKEVHTVDNATHGNIIDNPQYWKYIKTFLDKLFVKASEGEETPPAGGGAPPSWTTLKGASANEPPASLQTGRGETLCRGSGGDDPPRRGPGQRPGSSLLPLPDQPAAHAGQGQG